jgi:ketosteroid isomerase-like protein
MRRLAWNSARVARTILRLRDPDNGRLRANSAGEQRWSQLGRRAKVSLPIHFIGQESAQMKRFPIVRCLRGVVSVLIAAVAFAVLAPAAPAFAAGIDANARALAKLDDDWSKAAATRDAERVAAFYAEDAITYPPNEPMTTGRAAAKKVWAAYFADPTFKISWKTLHAGVSKSGDLGFTTGTYEDSYKGPDGKLVTENGKYVCIWQKQKDGSWKAIHDTWNSDSK